MIFSYLEMQRRLIQNKPYHNLSYSVWKKTSHKSLKAAAAKKSFSSVCTVNTAYFDECSLFHGITRHYSSYKFIVTQRFGTAAMLLRSLKQVFWNKSTFYIRYTHNYITMLLIPKVHFYFVFVDSDLYSFSFWMFHIFRLMANVRTHRWRYEQVHRNWFY